MAKAVAVIGGGAAGLMAAYQAAICGAQVYLFERNPNLGRKILISGKGRCNLTNAKELNDFITSYPGNGKFLYSALTTFSNKKLLIFFEKLGVKTKIERGGRVFPVSDSSFDIVTALQRAIINAGVKIYYKTRVKDLIIEGNRVKGIKFYNTNELFPCDSIIVATGGISYPATGSTGDGYKLAQQAGHTITKLRPSLVPLITLENWVKKLQGLSLKNVEATAYINNKKLSSQFGEMLFTHYGISGPIILTLSRDIIDHLSEHPVVTINLKPALTEQQLDSRLLKDFDLS